MRASAILLVWLACAAPAATQRPATPAMVLDMDGRERSVALAAGERSLVVHFWATWCPSCVEELAMLQRASASCGDRGVRVLAVNVAEDAAEVARYVAAHSLSLEVLRDASGEVWRSAGFRGLPANWFWTAQGVSSFTGPLTQPQWEARLHELGCAER